MLISTQGMQFFTSSAEGFSSFLDAKKRWFIDISKFRLFLHGYIFKRFDKIMMKELPNQTLKTED